MHLLLELHQLAHRPEPRSDIAAFVKAVLHRCALLSMGHGMEILI